MAYKYTRFLDATSVAKRLVQAVFTGSTPTESANTDDLIPVHEVFGITPGAAAANLGKAEDAAHASGDVGVMALGVRKDTPAALAGADGDYQPPILDADGRLWTRDGLNVTSSVTPTVSTTPAYTAGDAVGGKMTFTGAALVSGGRGTVLSVMLVDLAAQVPDLDLVLFSADPSGTTVTDNAALDVADADMSKIAGVVKIRSTDWVSFADNAVACKEVRLPFKLATGTSLYGALVNRSTPTFAGTSDVIVTLGIEQN